MNATVMEVREPNARYLTKSKHALLRGFELLATAPGAVAKLRELFIEFAIRGGLATQNPNDEPPIRLIAKAKAQRGAPATKQKLPATRSERSAPYALPTGWCWSSLGEIGLISPRNDVSDDTAASFVQMSSIPVAMMESHATETRQWRDIKSGFTHFAEGDVGVAKITPCFENGKSTVFRGLTNGIGAGTTELHVVRPLGGVVPEYILAFLKSPSFLRNGEVVMTGSAGQKRVPRAYFEDTPFPLPPLAEQHRIVARVEELMKLCDALEQSGRLADEQHTRLTSTLFDALAASESAHVLAENWRRVAEHFDLLLDRPEAVDALEQTILQLGVRGLLVPQAENDEPASALVAEIQAAKQRLIADGKLRRDNATSHLAEADPLFAIPDRWVWVPFGKVSINRDGERVPVPAEDRQQRAKVFDYYGASGIIDKIDGYLFDKTLLLIGEDGANLINRATPIAFLASGKYWVNNHAHVIDATHPDLMNYLCLFINSISLEPYITGTAQPKMNQAKLNAIPIALPPLAEQRRILARVEELRRICADLRGRLTQAREIQSRLADALVAEVA